MAGQSVSVGLNPETGKYLAVDDFTDALVVLQGDHYYIHEGKAFQYPCTFTLGDEEVKECVIIPPAASDGKYVHWRPTRTSTVTSAIKVELYEAPTYSGGTELTSIVNMNRNSSTTSSTKLIDGNLTVTNNGTLLSIDALGNGGRPQKAGGGSSGNENEIIFDPDKKYLLVYTNLTSTDTVVTSDIYWYEEEDG